MASLKGNTHEYYYVENSAGTQYNLVPTSYGNKKTVESNFGGFNVVDTVSFGSPAKNMVSNPGYEYWFAK